MKIIIIPNDKNNPPGKLADAELHFTMPDPATFHASLRPHFEALAGLKLIGFGVWERRTGGGRNVTFPSRQYSINGERRSFALLRPSGAVDATNIIRDAILGAYKDYEESCQTEDHTPGTITPDVSWGDAREKSER